MKVILKREVDNLGLPGDVVDVADGYGRNYLLPRGLAIKATRGAMKEAEAITRARKAHEAKTLDDARAFKEALESRDLRIDARVDERGTLYGSVTAADVQRILKERGHDIERRRIDLKGSIKQIGTYEIPVRVHPQVEANVTLDVRDEEGRITLDASGVARPDVDEEAVADAAGDAAEDSVTDAEVLAEQALQAARQFEREQQIEDKRREEAEQQDDDTAEGVIAES